MNYNLESYGGLIEGTGRLGDGGSGFIESMPFATESI